MADFLITTNDVSTLLSIDGKEAPFIAGDLYPYTTDRAGALVFLYEVKGVLKKVGSPLADSRDRFKIDLSTDTINIDGVTAFANAGELFDALKGALNPSAEKATILFSAEVASLADGAEIDSDWLQLAGVLGLLVGIRSDVAGLTLVQQDRRSAGGSVFETTIPLPLALANLPVQFPAREIESRFILQNNSGAPLTNVVFIVKATQVQPTITPLVLNPLPQSQALLTQSVLIGRDTFGQYRNSILNQAGALLTSDYGTEVARNIFPDVRLNKKFGRNSDIDVGSTPEDVWNGGGLYTGFNCIAAEQLEFFSSDATDEGTLVATGTADDSASHRLTDSAADFIADGVTVGDLIINDDVQFHGVVAEIVSSTELRAWGFIDGGVPEEDLVFSAGDTYRIVTTASTGAAVIKITELRDADYNAASEYIILNGTTGVLSQGSYLRQSSAAVILAAGLEVSNNGELTGRQSTTTANVTMIMPLGSGRTAISCNTVPAGKLWIIKDLQATLVRSNGSAGSGNMRFQTRYRGSSWQTRRFPPVSDAVDYAVRDIGGIIVPEFTDVRWNVESVSDNNSVVSAEFEYYEISI